MGQVIGVLEDGLASKILKRQGHKRTSPRVDKSDQCPNMYKLPRKQIYHPLSIGVKTQGTIPEEAFLSHLPSSYICRTKCQPGNWSWCNIIQNKVCECCKLALVGRLAQNQNVTVLIILEKFLLHRNRIGQCPDQSAHIIICCICSYFHIFPP